MDQKKDHEYFLACKKKKKKWPKLSSISSFVNLKEDALFKWIC